MSTVPERLAADTAAAIAGYGQTFTWNPAGGDAVENIPCVRNDRPSAKEILSSGGEVDLSIFSLTVAKADLTALAPALLARVVSLEAIGDGVNNGAAEIGWINGGNDPAAARIQLICKSWDSTQGGAHP